MHPSSLKNMRKAIERLPLRPGGLVLDVGGRNLKPDRDRSYASLFPGYQYRVADIEAGPNVTDLMAGPYDLPFADQSVDLVVSGQTFEHVRNPFRLLAEIGRVLKRGAFVIIIAPSAGPRHDRVDCWRFMDDAFTGLAAEAELVTVADWIDTTATDERSSRWRDHVWIGQRP